MSYRYFLTDLENVDTDVLDSLPDLIKGQIPSELTTPLEKINWCLNNLEGFDEDLLKSQRKNTMMSNTTIISFINKPVTDPDFPGLPPPGVDAPVDPEPEPDPYKEVTQQEVNSVISSEEVLDV